MSFGKASTPTWRAPGKLGTHTTLNFLGPCFSIYETELENAAKKKKKQFAGKSRPLRNPIRSITDWLAGDWET